MVKTVNYIKKKPHENHSTVAYAYFNIILELGAARVCFWDSFEESTEI